MDMKKSNKVKLTLIVLIMLQSIVFVIDFFVSKRFDAMAFVFLVLQIIFVAYFLRHQRNSLVKELTHIRDSVAPSYNQALSQSKTGILFYDDFYVITWMSEYLSNLGYSMRVGHKLLEWLPEVDELLKGDSDSVIVNLDEHYYRVEKSDEGQVLFLTDQTHEVNAVRVSQNIAPVLGMINLDNFDESTKYEDEYVASQVNGTIKSGIVNWCKEHQIICKRIRNDRYYLVTTYENYKKMADNDRFSILKSVRDQALELEIIITLSMSFAFGSDDLNVLDEQVINAMDLVQQRGGDQVAVKQIGKDVVFFGGNSEASEKRSRVRARVMAHGLKDLISRSSNVIIVGHKEADFDCIGSALGMASIVSSLNKPCCFVGKSGGIEAKVNSFLEDNEEFVNEHFRFVTEAQAINELDDQALVIMVDHNSLMQCSASNCVKQAKRVVIIDHHRRPENLMIKPMMVYIEPGCSSTSEMVCEFFSYMGHKVKVDSLVATLMYTGILVDTQRFKNRTGQRTFDAASKLLDLRADGVLAEQILKDSYKDFEKKISWFNKTSVIFPGYYLVSMETTTTRSFMSQIADGLLDIDDAKAVFVMAKLDDHQVGISARSGGEVNVQIIMEAMHGGGHRTAAAVQRNNVSMDELKEELKQAIQSKVLEA